MQAAPGAPQAVAQLHQVGMHCFHAHGLEGGSAFEGTVLQAADPATVEKDEAGQDDSQEGLDPQALREPGFPTATPSIPEM